MTSPTSRTSDAPAVTASVRIAAPPDVVFPYFTDPALAVKWIADAAYLDARPGGTFSVERARQSRPRGEFVEVDPPRRVVFTLGHRGARPTSRRGAARSRWCSQPDGDDTVVTLTHRDLPTEEYRRSHQGGWTEFLGILARSGLLGCCRTEPVGRRAGSEQAGAAASAGAPAAATARAAKRERVTVFVQRGLDLAGTAECTRGCPTMFLEESPEQQQLRAELRQYYAELLTDEVRAGLAEGGEGGEAWSQVVRQIGKDGWLGIGWPTEFGGQGRPATDQFIFFDETRRAGAPFPFVTINTVGPDHHALRHRRAEVVLPARRSSPAS